MFEIRRLCGPDFQQICAKYNCMDWLDGVRTLGPDQKSTRTQVSVDLCDQIFQGLGIHFNPRNIQYYPMAITGENVFHPILFIKGQQLPKSFGERDKLGTTIPFNSIDLQSTLSVPVVAADNPSVHTVTNHEMAHAADVGSVQRNSLEPQNRLYDELIGCLGEHVGKTGPIRINANHLMGYIEARQSPGLFQVAKLSKSSAKSQEICEGLSARIYELTEKFSVNDVSRLLISCGSFDELYSSLVRLGFQ